MINPNDSNVSKCPVNDQKQEKRTCSVNKYIKHDGVCGWRRRRLPPDVLLLTDLLCLHGGGVFSAEAQLCDGHVVQDDVEVFSSLEQISADQQRHLEEEGDERVSDEL